MHEPINKSITPFRLACFLISLLLIACSLTVFPDGQFSDLNFFSSNWHPIYDQRIPRLIVLISSGASLAVAGAIMQALFQNPLASPSVLGISLGGSLLVVIVCALDLHLETPYAIPIAAFIGCFFTMLIVYNLSRSPEGILISTLVLTGIAISTVLLALQGALLYSLRDRWQLIMTLTEWEAGSTQNISWSQVHMQLPLTLVGLYGAIYYRKTLNLLALGDEEALMLGVEVKEVRFRLILCVSLLTGGTLAAIGIIAFLGLILPHLVRSLIGSDNNRVVPFSLLSGGALLPLLDALLRYYEIYNFTIGNISAVLGGLFFLVLLYRIRRQESYALML